MDMGKLKAQRTAHFCGAPHVKCKQAIKWRCKRRKSLQCATVAVAVPVAVVVALAQTKAGALHLYISVCLCLCVYVCVCVCCAVLRMRPVFTVLLTAFLSSCNQTTCIKLHELALKLGALSGKKHCPGWCCCCCCGGCCSYRTKYPFGQEFAG